MSVVTTCPNSSDTSIKPVGGEGSVSLATGPSSFSDTGRERDSGRWVKTEFSRAIVCVCVCVHVRVLLCMCDFFKNVCVWMSESGFVSGYDYLYGSVSAREASSFNPLMRIFASIIMRNELC